MLALSRPRLYIVFLYTVLNVDNDLKARVPYPRRDKLKCFNVDKFVSILCYYGMA